MAYLVATDERELRGEGPVAVLSMEVGMADARAVELDETLARGEVLGLLDGVVVDKLERGAGGLNDRGLLGLGDSELGRHGGTGGCELGDEGGQARGEGLYSAQGTIGRGRGA